MAHEEEVPSELSVDELRDQLDTLWEKHLALLNSYHQAQQQIARHFSSGFFDLAQATFKSTTRVRYGQEYYDDRMQATTCFHASVDANDTPRFALKINDTTATTKDSHKGASNKSDVETGDTQEDTPTQQPTPPSTPLRESGEKETKEHSQKENSETADDKGATPKKPRDPLHWYGILVPPSLRSSQKSFQFAINDPVVDAVNSAQALRRIDMEIRKLRKDIKKAEKRVA
ncbi:unnamed protein product [Aureobasidium vineae]|uniref:Vacuolar ATPase assembly protein VMA22 n=1 Tax=Aureobasidium vineae TaxID=2773715 RepID=A0A9N8PAD9_9PEZI|nr:unnamed protein product [Aureobasidium vineae]